MVAQYPLVHGVVGATAKGGNFNTVLYQGNSLNGRAIIGVGFRPDLVWIKDRSGANSHSIFDANRGVQRLIESDTTDAEASISSSLQSFDSDGFTVGTFTQVNLSPNQYVAWCWRADEAASDPTHDGERYNLKTGLSIIKYTGEGAVKTINHSLGAIPKLQIIKLRDITMDWAVYHEGIAADPENWVLRLNKTDNAVNSSIYWNQAPTATQFTVGTDGSTGGQTGGNYIAYLFADVPGFSQFGHYIGNGSATGPTITTGFRPGFLLVKGTDTTSPSYWPILDSVRSPSNPRQKGLLANTNDAESDAGAFAVDFNDTSFQIKNAHPSGWYNENGKRYVYACFAEAA